MTSPLYCAEMLGLPVGRVAVTTACAVAAAVAVEAVPVTVTALPSGEPLFRSCIVPVGAAPLLSVETVAVTVNCAPAKPDDGKPLMDVDVGAVETDTVSMEGPLPV